MLDFIINPIAGGKHGKKMKKTLTALKSKLESCGVAYTFHYTQQKGDGVKYTKDLISNGATDIIVVGGDGTLHEVINGFSNFDKVALGIIPCGTGNDFSSALKLPLNPELALDVILNGKPQYTDFMQMPTVRGLNVIGTGIDVDVLKRYESLKRKTKFGYTSSLIKTLCNFEYSDFTVDVDGKEEKHRSFIAAIANGHRFGGGIPVCPVADPADGELNLVTVAEMKKIKIIGAFIKLKAGKVLSLKQTKHQLGKCIKITPDKPYTVNVDGELYDNIPFEVSVVSNTLRVYR